MVYTVDSMEHAIEQCKKNIKIFEDAADKERASIKKFRTWIELEQEQQQKKKEAQENINIEVVRED